MTQSQPRPPPSQLAGYDSDDVGTIDRLDIKADVETLASVLAATDVEPPVSVGLFGDWGTGKSFFMNALQSRIEELEKATVASSGASAYCRSIKHIRFNTWHYADANLWASLVTEIFDALASSDDEKTRAMLTELDTAKQAREEAEARRDQATAVRDELRDQIENLERNARKLGLLTQTTLENRAAAPVQADALLRVVDEQAKPDDPMRLRDISALADDLAGIGGAMRTVVRITGWKRVLVVLVLAAATFAVLQVLTGNAAGVIGAVAAAAAPLASPLERARKAAQAAAGAARLIQSEVQRAEIEVASQRAERERLTQQLIAAEKDIVAAEQEMEAMSAGRMVARFVQERAAADDYRKHLGLVSLIRRDFVKLSTLMSAATDPPFDRIVLYIDDLDRCPPARVVEVLEAVHLLLALRLFVVVVAVDSRWLLRSLEIHYQALRRTDQNDGAEDDYWVATPQNYLEKIFQIPYAVRPMALDGYRSLVDAMLGASEANDYDEHDASHPRTPTSAPTRGVHPPRERRADTDEERTRNEEEPPAPRHDDHAPPPPPPPRQARRDRQRRAHQPPQPAPQLRHRAALKRRAAAGRPGRDGARRPAHDPGVRSLAPQPRPAPDIHDGCPTPSQRDSGRTRQADR
jgi:hypothetical protein